MLVNVINDFVNVQIIIIAMVSKLDQSVGEVVSALNRRGMLENSIVLFLSDNGAPTIDLYANYGSNYPFRGVRSFIIFKTCYLLYFLTLLAIIFLSLLCRLSKPFGKAQ